MKNHAKPHKNAQKHTKHTKTAALWQTNKVIQTFDWRNHQNISSNRFSSKKFKFLIRGFLKTFHPINLGTNNIQIFDWKNHQNISSNRCGYKKCSNFWSEDFLKHFLQSIWAPTILKFLIGGFLKTFPPINLCTTNIQVFDWRNHQNISSNRFGYKKYSNFWSEDFTKHSPEHFLQTIGLPNIFKVFDQRIF